MAKKKTTGPDSTTGTPAGARRRGPGNTSKTDDAARAQASASAEALDAGGSAATADDRGQASSVSASSGGAAPSPSYEEIAEAAYQRYLSRGGGHGHDFEDWVEAERELQSRR